MQVQHRRFPARTIVPRRDHRSSSVAGSLVWGVARTAGLVWTHKRKRPPKRAQSTVLGALTYLPSIGSVSIPRSVTLFGLWITLFVSVTDAPSACIELFSAATATV